MATRSPTAAHAYWGVFATTADLPNVAASPTQKGTLEAGDQAYVTGSGLYVCTTATLGAAVWVLVGGGAGPFVDISLDAVVTGAGPEVVGAVYLFSGSVILAASRSLLGTLAGGTATLRVRRQSTGVLVAGFEWSVTGVITNAVLVGNVNIVADDWYMLELERDAGPTVALCYGVQLIR